ncbi:hypothetical protein KR51_00026040 [Rubidibacter lacunae KORDI 51-2]|uniref:Uncharacterized protein n=1 Tax=Rubidibacter lacunae KORDI 51-2 TaxID=582515 RepID=U5DH16_9CHRO|nr:hypothetical protein KR51_00026040 [Rubidibacter lacunae KORDI 51-2]
MPASHYENTNEVLSGIQTTSKDVGMQLFWQAVQVRPTAIATESQNRCNAGGGGVWGRKLDRQICFELLACDRSASQGELAGDRRTDCKQEVGIACGQTPHKSPHDSRRLPASIATFSAIAPSWIRFWKSAASNRALSLWSGKDGFFHVAATERVAKRTIDIGAVCPGFDVAHDNFFNI